MPAAAPHPSPHWPRRRSAPPSIERSPTDGARNPKQSRRVPCLCLVLTGLPLAPSWMRTLTMSTGWMMHVAAMPLRPPLTNGLAAFHAALSDMALLREW